MFNIGCSMNRPMIDCFDPNNSSSDTSYYVSNKSYQGFIFPAKYQPMISINEQRFTPNKDQIERVELILAQGPEDSDLKYKRQYLGSLNTSLDSLITIRLLRRGFREECFDKIVAFGFGEYYEKNQRIKVVNLKTKEIE